MTWVNTLQKREDSPLYSLEIVNDTIALQVHRMPEGTQAEDGLDLNIWRMPFNNIWIISDRYPQMGWDSDHKGVTIWLPGHERKRDRWIAEYTPEKDLYSNFFYIRDALEDWFSGRRPLPTSW